MNNNSANFHNNVSRISILYESLTTTMPTFEETWEKFELFEDLFQTSLKIHNQLTEEDKKNYFHSLMRGDALQTFQNVTSPNRESLRAILTAPLKKRETSVNGYNEAQISTTGLQSGEPEVIWFSIRTPETCERCIRCCSSSHHWTIHIGQNASPPDEINQPGAFGEWHI